MSGDGWLEMNVLHEVRCKQVSILGIEGRVRVCMEITQIELSGVIFTCLFLVHFQGSSGKSIPELERTIGLMKKVVERVQQENETLKKAPGVTTQTEIHTLRDENKSLKVSLREGWGLEAGKGVWYGEGVWVINNSGS